MIYSENIITTLYALCYDKNTAFSLFCLQELFSENVALSENIVNNKKVLCTWRHNVTCHVVNLDFDKHGKIDAVLFERVLTDVVAAYENFFKQKLINVSSYIKGYGTNTLLGSTLWL